MKALTKAGLIILGAGVVLAAIGWSLSGKYSNTGKTTSYTETADAYEKDIKNIDIDSSFGNINIVKGDSIKFVADDVLSKYSMHLAHNGNTLSIDSDKKIKNKPFGENFDFGFNNTQSGNYTLYLPDKLYDEISVSTSFSDLSISNIKCRNASFDISFSEAAISNLNVSSNLKLNSSFADTNVDMGGSKLETLSLDSSFGDFKINNAEVTNSVDISSSFGDVNLKLKGDKYSVKKNYCSFGDTNFNSDFSGGTPISIDSSFGDISFDK